jgi:hypothetical protein
MHGLRLRVETLHALLSLLALAPIAHASAQQSSRSTVPPLELRVDAIDVHSVERGTLQGGVGVNAPLGYYARLELVAAVGATRRDSVSEGSGRVDAIVRFLLDPFAESAWGLSIGGGVSTLITQQRTRPYIVVALDLEAPRVGPVVPALQLGLGGGVRVGIAVRAYRHGQR